MEAFLLYGTVMLVVAGWYWYRVREPAPLPTLGSLLVGTLVWTLLPVGFFVFLWFSGRLPLESWLGWEIDPRQAVPYLTAYLSQRILVLANLILVAIVFTKDRVPTGAQNRILRWILLLVVITRGGAFVLSETFFTFRHPTLTYLLGAVLFLSTLQVLSAHTQPTSGEAFSNSLLGWFMGPSYPRFVEDWFFVPLPDGFRRTPLVEPLTHLVGATLLLGAGTVPTLYPVRGTLEVGLVASLFSVLGMHCTYLLMARLLQKIRHFKTALGFSVSVLATSTLLIPHQPIPYESLLTILLGILAIGLIGSVRVGSSDPASLTTPLPPADLMQFLIDNARRLVVAVVGFTLLILGILMMVLPGPGILTVLAALGVLGMEFVWARKLLKQSQKSSKNAWDWVRERLRGKIEEEQEPDSSEP